MTGAWRFRLPHEFSAGGVPWLRGQRLLLSRRFSVIAVQRSAAKVFGEQPGQPGGFRCVACKFRWRSRLAASSPASAGNRRRPSGSDACALSAIQPLVGPYCPKQSVELHRSCLW